MIPWRIGLITPVYFAVIFIIKLKEREGREVIFKMLSSISNWFPNRWFYVIIIPPAWPMKLPIIYTQIWCGRGVGTLVAIWGYSVEKKWGHTMKCTTRYSCNPANRLIGSCHHFSGLNATRKRNRFLSFLRRPLSCQSKIEKQLSRDSFKSVKCKEVQENIDSVMPYLLTLLAIMEKLYCAVLSLSSNSLVAMVPSVPSIVK